MKLREIIIFLANISLATMNPAGYCAVDCNGIKPLKEPNQVPIFENTFFGDIYFKNSEETVYRKPPYTTMEPKDPNNSPLLKNINDFKENSNKKRQTNFESVQRAKFKSYSSRNL
ncbi:hypothetical protein K9L16_00885 [Candidatus Pacearchaeota archaeon]|nr:hypothetical protein [Candidatus Pacearchaeota archaeon]